MTASTPPTPTPHILILGAGVIGLSTALTLRRTLPPSTRITLTATHFPGDRSIAYTSPWAGANWCSFATDNGPLEAYDRVTFERFREIEERGEGPAAGIGMVGMWGVFDAEIGDSGVLSEGTGRVWYEELVGGLRPLGEDEGPAGKVWGVEYGGTWRVDSGVYLGWLQNQVRSKGVQMVRRTYASLGEVLGDFPDAAVLVNCSGLGSLTLEDVKDENLFPTRGQTVLVAEPKTPIPRMYFRSPARIDPKITYVFPRPHGGGVILGGSRQENDWSAEIDMELSKDIMKRCCELCPELGKPEDLQVISHNVGLRPSRKGGPRIELERWANGTPVVHCYGHSGAGFQSSWGTAERVAELVRTALEPKAKL